MTDSDADQLARVLLRIASRDPDFPGRLSYGSQVLPDGEAPSRPLPPDGVEPGPWKVEPYDRISLLLRTPRFWVGQERADDECREHLLRARRCVGRALARGFFNDEVAVGGVI